MLTKLSRLAAIIGVICANTTSAASFTTVQDGLYWCSVPGSCAWAQAGIPGGADSASISHFVTLWGQGATPPSPLVLPLGSLNLLPGGTMGIYELRRLQFGGGTWSGGALDSCCNGGGTLNNTGQLDVTGNPVLAFRGILENNATLRVAPGARLLWNAGNGGGLVSNLTTSPTPAVLQFDGDGVVAGVVTINNEGVVRKTGNGTAVFYGKLRNMGTSLVYPGRIDVQAGTLAIADVGADHGQLVSEGGSITVAAGTVLAIRNGGAMHLVPEGQISQAYVTTGSGAGRVRLEAGGLLYGAPPLGDSSTPAVMNFAPGVFEWTGGAMTDFQIRNNGDITISGPDDKLLNGVDFRNAGNMHLLAPVLRNAGVLRILPGGVFEAADGTAILGLGNSVLAIDGQMRKTAGSGTFKLDNVFSVIGSGTLQINGGHLLLNGTSQYELDSFDGTVQLTGNAAIDIQVAGHSVVIKDTATLTGVGSVTAGTLEQRGLLEPGAPFGAFVVPGYLLQNPGANPQLLTTRISIGGPVPVTQHAQIQVGGNLRPYGTLKVNFRDGYSPFAGDYFDLITVGGVLTDTLARYQVVIEGLAPGFLYTLTLSPQNTVRLTALNHVPSLADLVFRDGFEN